MQAYVEEMTAEEVERTTQRSILRSNLRDQAKAANGGIVHCTYCRCVLSRSRTRLSHIVPLGMGGETTAENVVLACPNCADSKNFRTLEQWRDRLQTQVSEVQRLLTYHPNPMPKAKKPAA